MKSATLRRLAGTLLGLAGAIAIAAPASDSAVRSVQARPAPVPHLQAHPWRFGPFPQRLTSAARRVFHARPHAAAARRPYAVGPMVVGGSSATQGSFGYMATVLYFDSSGNPEFLCSGTLVSSNVVLTAGHCGADETTGVPNSASGYRVVTNAVDWTDTTNRQISDVSQVVLDPNFSPTTLSGDASMLVLTSSVSSPPLPIWTAGALYAGTDGTVAGWGETYAGQPSAQTALQWAPTVIQNVSYCTTEAQDMGYDYNSASELCTVNGPSETTATCNGDSGGPLVTAGAQGVQTEVGITSVGPADCDTTTADFFTSVLPIQSWIESEISAASGSSPADPSTPAPTTPTAVTSTPTTTPVASPSAKAKLRRMTTGAARSYTARVLTGILRRAFGRRTHYAVRCARASASRMSCATSFSSGASHYYGNVTVYYAFGPKNVMYWSDRYTMRWVNDYCYFKSGHRGDCRISIRRGIY